MSPRLLVEQLEDRLAPARIITVIDTLASRPVLDGEPVTLMSGSVRPKNVNVTVTAHGWVFPSAVHQGDLQNDIFYNPLLFLDRSRDGAPERVLTGEVAGDMIFFSDPAGMAFKRRMLFRVQADIHPEADGPIQVGGPMMFGHKIRSEFAPGVGPMFTPIDEYYPPSPPPSPPVIPPPPPVVPPPPPPPTGNADVSVSLVADQSSIQLGGDVLLTMNVTNLGGEIARNAFATVVWDDVVIPIPVGDLAPGQSFDPQFILVRAEREGELGVTASLTTDSVQIVFENDTIYLGIPVTPGFPVF